LDGTVWSLMAGPTPGTVYVGGQFNNVSGTPLKGLALLSLSDGSIVKGWKFPYENGIVQDLAVSQGHLVLGGTFTEVNHLPRLGMASVDPSTGVLDDYATNQFTGHHNYGVNGTLAQAAVGITKFDITPDGTKMV